MRSFAAIMGKVWSPRDMEGSDSQKPAPLPPMDGVVGVLTGVIRAAALLRQLCKSPKHAKVQLSVLHSRADACLAILEVCERVIPTATGVSKSLLSPGVSKLSETVDTALALVKRVTSMPKLLWKLRSRWLAEEMTRVSRELAEQAGFLSASASFIQLANNIPTPMEAGLCEKKADLLASAFWRRHFGKAEKTSATNLYMALDKELPHIQLPFRDLSVSVTLDDVKRLLVPTLSMVRHTVDTGTVNIADEDMVSQSDLDLIQSERKTLIKVLQARNSFVPHANRIVTLIDAVHRAKRHLLELRMLESSCALDIEDAERLEHRTVADEQLSILREKHVATLREAMQNGLDESDAVVRRLATSIIKTDRKLAANKPVTPTSTPVQLRETRRRVLAQLADVERLVLDAEHALAMAQEASKPSADVLMSLCSRVKHSALSPIISEIKDGTNVLLLSDPDSQRQAQLQHEDITLFDAVVTQPLRKKRK